MKALIKNISQFVQVAADYVQGILFFAICTLVAYFVGKNVLAPLSPVITFLFVLTFTVFTLSKRKTAILAIGGITLYLLSWPALHQWGVATSILIWAIGVFSWFSGVYSSFKSEMPHVSMKMIFV